MKPLTLDWRPSARLRRHRAMAWLVLYAFCVAITGCLGGQTGTEAAPRDPERSGNTGGTSTKDGSEGGTGIPATSQSPNADELGCVKDPPPGAGLDQQTGIDTSEVVAFLEATNPIHLEYGDGGVTSAVLKIATTNDACAAPSDAGPNSLRVSTEVGVLSDDGRIQLSLKGSIDAMAAAAGGVGGVTLVASQHCERSADPSTLSQCSIAGIDVSAYTSLIVELNVKAQSSTATTHLLGSLRLSAVDSTRCTSSPCAASDWNVIGEMALTSGI